MATPRGGDTWASHQAEGEGKTGKLWQELLFRFPWEQSMRQGKRG